MYSKQHYLQKKYEMAGLWPLKIKEDDPEHVKFWKNISLPPDIIPECSKCKQDTERYKAMTSQERLKFKAECCRYCLWWNWFDNKRKLIK